MGYKGQKDWNMCFMVLLQNFTILEATANTRNVPRIVLQWMFILLFMTVHRLLLYREGCGRKGTWLGLRFVYVAPCGYDLTWTYFSSKEPY
jgi:hypothetical protein